MASQARKHRGFRTERVVAEYLSTWWQGACVGRGSGKDIVNVPFDIEVKARAGFQPPTKGHLEVVKKAIEKYNPNKFIIFVGTGGGRSNITQDQSLAIWNIYKNYLPDNVVPIPTEFK